MEFLKIEYFINLYPTVPHKFQVNTKILEEILFNLIKNAVEFNRKKGKIWVNIYHLEGSKKLTIEVKDSGIGIHITKQKQLFKNSLTSIPTIRNPSDPDYVGIGLKNAKILCKSLRGNISIQSRE